ncbi:Gfo/Idh/MocA family oxidoreductase [Bacillaceae bacterium S4-13-58]
MNNVKVGMLSFAHMHAFSYFDSLIDRDDVTIVGISDEDADRVRGLIDQYKISYFKDYKDLLKTDADIIIINSENAFHAEHTIASANAKKHVMCEKPLGTSMEDMKDMIQACKDNKVQLMTAFPNRYVPSIVEAKDLIDKGELGELIAIKATNKGAMPGGWFVNNDLSGGGAMLDHSVHVADILNWILSSEIEEVYAENGTLFYKELTLEDSAMITMKFKNGVLATLDTSWSRTEPYPYKRDLTMHFVGTEGTLFIDYFKQISEVYSKELNHAEWSYWGDNKDELLVDDLIERFKNGKEVPITGEDGLASGKISLAAYESVKKIEVIKFDKD